MLEVTGECGRGGKDDPGFQPEHLKEQTRCFLGWGRLREDWGVPTPFPSAVRFPTSEVILPPPFPHRAFTPSSQFQLSLESPPTPSCP